MVESKFKRRNDIEEEGKIVRLNSDSAHYKIRLDHLSTGHLADGYHWKLREQLTRDICVQQGVGGRILLRFQSPPAYTPCQSQLFRIETRGVNPALWLNRGSRHAVVFFFSSPASVDRATTCGWPLQSECKWEKWVQCGLKFTLEHLKNPSKVSKM